MGEHWQCRISPQRKIAPTTGYLRNRYCAPTPTQIDIDPEQALRSQATPAPRPRLDSATALTPSYTLIPPKPPSSTQALNQSVRPEPVEACPEGTRRGPPPDTNPSRQRIPPHTPTVVPAHPHARHSCEGRNLEGRARGVSVSRRFPTPPPTLTRPPSANPDTRATLPPWNSTQPPLSRRCAPLPQGPHRRPHALRRLIPGGCLYSAKHFLDL